VLTSPSPTPPPTTPVLFCPGRMPQRPAPAAVARSRLTAR
jgi:hypothetical protein